MQLPRLSNKPLIPTPPQLPDLEKIEKDEESRKQRKHDWLITLFGTISGGVMGLITSLIFWLITK